MPYTLRYIESDGYLVSHHRGEVTAAELRAARQDARRLAAESGEKRLLIDFREASSIPGVGDSYFIVQESASNRMRGTRTAVVSRAEHLMITEFIAFAATTAGLVVKVFQDEGDALRWLCKR